MPSHEKKRIKPVIEEVVETKPEEIASEVTEQVETKDLALENQQEAPTESVEEIGSIEETPKKEVKKMNLKLIVIITLVSALVAAFVSGGVYVYLSGVEEVSTPIETQTPEPAASSTPEPTQAPEPVDITQYSVQVLNGSGVIGAAGTAEDVLTKAGFNVEDTGNASRINFEKTLIQVKQDVPAGAVSQLKKALEAEDYSVETGETLPSNSEFDIVVTVGRN